MGSISGNRSGKQRSPWSRRRKRTREDFKALKRFLFEHVYKSPQVCIMNRKREAADPDPVFSAIWKIARKCCRRPYSPGSRRRGAGPANRRVIVDYISGMTDRYAMDLYQMMFEPYEKVMVGFRELIIPIYRPLGWVLSQYRVWPSGSLGKGFPHFFFGLTRPPVLKSSRSQGPAGMALKVSRFGPASLSKVGV